MTYQQALQQALDNLGTGKSTDIQKLIAFAYFAGQEKATKEICDKASKIFAEQNERANNCRYHKMALEVVGNQKFIYSENYSGEYTEEFKNDIIDMKM